jgi:serine/threonine protein kinase
VIRTADPLLGRDLVLGSSTLRVIAPAATEGRAATYEVEVVGRGAGFLKLARNIPPQSELLAGLSNEAEVLRCLGFDGVPRLLDAGSFDEGGFALVTRWAAGTPMSGWDAAPTTVRRALARLGVTLGRVHDAGFVHADVRPGNVLVDGDTPTLVDFDAAVVLGACQPAFVGAPHFSPPEQREGAALSPAADVFSFAATARRMLPAQHLASDPVLDELLARACDPRPLRRPGLDTLCEALAR